MYLQTNRIMRLLLFGGADEDFREANEAMEQFKLIAFVLHDPEMHWDLNGEIIRGIENLHHRSATDLLFFAKVDSQAFNIESEVTREYFKRLQAFEAADHHAQREELGLHDILNELKIPAVDGAPCIVVFNNLMAKAYRWYKSDTRSIGRQLAELGLLATEFPQMKDKWKFAAHKLNEIRTRLNLCDRCGQGFLAEKKAPRREGVLTDYEQYFGGVNNFEDYHPKGPEIAINAEKHDQGRGPDNRDYPSRHAMIKEKCIKIADDLWTKAQKSGDTILSTGAMAQRHEIVEIAKMNNRNPYKKDTIQKWLSDAGKKYGADAPGTRPGTKKRPPK